LLFVFYEKNDSLAAKNHIINQDQEKPRAASWEKRKV